MTGPDLAELRRRLDALPGFALRHLHGGPGVEPYIALADEGGMPLSESGFDAVLLFAEIAALEVPRLLDRLAHMTEARDNARAEVERLAAKLDAIEADDDKLSIMFGWLVYDVGEHTCGGYGPESGYAHEPGCGFEPVLRLDKLEGWPGQKPLDGALDAAGERDALAAKVERVRRECVIGKSYAGWAAMSRAVLAILDEEPQP